MFDRPRAYVRGRAVSFCELFGGPPVFLRSRRPVASLRGLPEDSPAASPAAVLEGVSSAKHAGRGHGVGRSAVAVESGARPWPWRRARAVVLDVVLLRAVAVESGVGCGGGVGCGAVAVKLSVAIELAV